MSLALQLSVQLFPTWAYPDWYGVSLPFPTSKKLLLLPGVIAQFRHTGNFTMFSVTG